MYNKIKFNEQKIKIIGALLSIALLIIDYLLKWKIFPTIGKFFVFLYNKIILPIISDFFERPYLIIILFILLVGLYFLWKRVKIVAGEFREKFKNGLINWEFGGEGWTIEQEGGVLGLSVTNSSDGGITNFGLWDNFEFSFKCKIINKNVGWIIRATDRVNYFMIQVSLDNIEKPTINPHFRINGEWLKEKRNLILKNPISINEWFQVVIKVYGNTINVFINNQHALHYFIPDPGRTITSRPIIMTKLDETNGSKEDIEKFVQQHNMIFSFPNGKVGFRCHGNEHAHFKNIKVIPLPRM